MNEQRTSVAVDDGDAATEQLLLQLLHSHQNQAPRLLQRVLQFVQNRTDFGRQTDLSSLQRIVSQLLSNSNSNGNRNNHSHHCNQKSKITAAKISGCGGGCMATTRSMHAIARPSQSKMLAKPTTEMATRVCQLLPSLPSPLPSSSSPTLPPPSLPPPTRSTCHVTSCCDSLHKSSSSLSEIRKSTTATTASLLNKPTVKLPFQQRIIQSIRQQQPQSARDDHSHWVTFENPTNNQSNESIAQCTCIHQNNQLQTASSYANHHHQQQIESIKHSSQMKGNLGQTVSADEQQQQQYATPQSSTPSSSCSPSPPPPLTLSEQQNDPETQNGSRVFEPDGRIRYSWSQTLHETELLLPMSPEMRRGTQCRVFIRTHNLTVLINERGVWQHRLDGRLRYPIRPDGCFWTLEPGQSLKVMLEKAEPRWWTCVLEGDDEISLNRIHRNVSLHELDEREQQVVHQLMHRRPPPPPSSPSPHQQQVNVKTE